MGEAKLGGASRTGYRPPLRSPPHFVKKKERSKKSGRGGGYYLLLSFAIKY
jgi:hypothetical protein